MTDDTNQLHPILHELSDQAIVKIAAPMMDNIIDGSTEENWEKHTQYFSDATKAKLTEEELLRQCSHYKSKFGDFASRELLGVTKHPSYVNVLWKQTMTQSEGEYMAILTLVNTADGLLGGFVGAHELRLKLECRVQKTSECF